MCLRMRKGTNRDLLLEFGLGLLLKRFRLHRAPLFAIHILVAVQVSVKPVLAAFRIIAVPSHFEELVDVYIRLVQFGAVTDVLVVGFRGRLVPPVLLEVLVEGLRGHPELGAAVLHPAVAEAVLEGTAAFGRLLSGRRTYFFAVGSVVGGFGFSLVAAGQESHWSLATDFFHNTGKSVIWTVKHRRWFVDNCCYSDGFWER